MAMTRLLNISAPVFACLEFMERDGINHLDEFYEPTKEREESAREEESYRFMEDWGEHL